MSLQEDIWYIDVDSREDKYRNVLSALGAAASCLRGCSITKQGLRQVTVTLAAVHHTSPCSFQLQRFCVLHRPCEKVHGSKVERAGDFASWKVRNH